MIKRNKGFKTFLKNSLKQRIPEGKLQFLPSGFQRIGDIIILALDDKVKEYSKDIGKSVLDEMNARSVLAKTGPVSGEFREPRLSLIAGDKNTETIHKEGGCIYKLDPMKVMFAKGNVLERGRVARLVKPNETVIDMFAGIGYFSIRIARACPSCRVIAMEKNPAAFRFLKENIKINKLNNIKPILGDCREASRDLENSADRVLMGYLPGTNKFIDSAFFILKDKGIIHYHDVFGKEELWEKPMDILKKEAEKNGYSLEKALHKDIVKQYSPGKYHVVLDVFLKTKK